MEVILKEVIGVAKIPKYTIQMDLLRRKSLTILKTIQLSLEVNKMLP